MKGAIVVDYVNRCIKFDLPNGKTADLLLETMKSMTAWKQLDKQDPESCGFILGYKNNKTGNITLSDITTPQKEDYRTRILCKIKDNIHFYLLKKKAEKKNFYMGVWHTHPESTPTPSNVDWHDWREVLKNDKTGSEYAFFIIIGTCEFRIWVGNFDTKEIVEVSESEMKDSVYVKRNVDYEN